ncbi:MAG: UvrD-helicase domain-containing protein, partial [Ideonella sp.]|nr:UvrD-helicase domain-containing protein [Ideonella sp.]
MHRADSAGKPIIDAAASPLLANLNPEQLAAVTLPPQPALILAGAGSGKTRVLTTRIAWLLATGQVSPGGVLAVTFTNKAAKEMLTRLAAMLPINVRGMWIGTFHGLCNRLLRAHWKLAALPQSFQILDSADQVSAVKRVIKAMNLDEERYVPRQVAWFIAGNKEEGLRPRDVQAHDPPTRKMIEIYQAYEDQCQREGVVDFAELMLRAFELLRDNDPLREHYQRRFAHVLVDEFQDTNSLQYRWLKLFAPPPGAASTLAGQPAQGVFAVGDDDQSIYAFRGAQVENILGFEKEFPDAKIVILGQNYRSSATIVSAADAVIRHNSGRAPKRLFTGNDPGSRIRLFRADSEYDEARFVANGVREMVVERGLRPSQIAVFYRTNALSRLIEHQLVKASVPYQVARGVAFYQRKEIKDALAYARVIANPLDEVSLLRIINVPPRGIGKTTVERLAANAAETQRPLREVIADAADIPEVKRAARELLAFAQFLADAEVTARHGTIRDLLEFLVRNSGRIALYSKDDEESALENL